MDQSLNLRLEIEMENLVYDVIEEAIKNTAKKHHYKQIAIVKLVDAIYNGSYEYITKDNDYRIQVKMLDEYFQKTYNHHVITLSIIKKIRKIKNTELYNVIDNDLTKITKKLTTQKIDLKDLLDDDYNKVMTLIETNQAIRYSVEVIYEKILKKERKKGKNNGKIL